MADPKQHESSPESPKSAAGWDDLVVEEMSSQQRMSAQMLEAEQDVDQSPSGEGDLWEVVDEDDVVSTTYHNVRERLDRYEASRSNQVNGTGILEDRPSLRASRSQGT